MAKVRNNIVIKGLSGSLGDQLVLKQDKAGRTIVSVKPDFDPNHEFSAAQKEVQEHFREATAYAKTAKTNEVYVAKADGAAHSAYNVAVADWFHAPEVLELDASAWDGQAEQVIRIKAMDDVQVTAVSVVITTAADVVVEQGQAIQADGLWWEYTTSADFTAPGQPKVIVTARDLPGHIDEFQWSRPA